MRFRKGLMIGLSALMVSSMACQMGIFADDAAENGTRLPNRDAVNTAVTDETLVIDFASEPSSLWGAGTGKVENEMLMIDMAIMDTLVALDPETSELKPSLATSWEMTDDTHCRFTLRDDVTMTDGTPLVADYVVYSVNTWIHASPQYGSVLYRK